MVSKIHMCWGWTKARHVDVQTRSDPFSQHTISELRLCVNEWITGVAVVLKTVCVCVCGLGIIVDSLQVHYCYSVKRRLFPAGWTMVQQTMSPHASLPLGWVGVVVQSRLGTRLLSFEKERWSMGSDSVFILKYLAFVNPVEQVIVQDLMCLKDAMFNCLHGLANTR